MRIIDAHTGRDVRVGDVLPIPGGGGSYQIVELAPGPILLALNKIGYATIGWGLTPPKIRVRSSDQPTLNGWVPLQVRLNHPSFPGEAVAFIPS